MLSPSVPIVFQQLSCGATASAAPGSKSRSGMRASCVRLVAFSRALGTAHQAARAIGIRFASIDVVSVDGRWQILEVNSGVMMESLSKHHPELVYAAYDAALDKVFFATSARLLKIA